MCVGGGQMAAVMVGLCGCGTVPQCIAVELELPVVKASHTAICEWEDPVSGPMRQRLADIIQRGMHFETGCPGSGIHVEGW